MEYLILFLPLLASIISGFFGKLIGDKISQIITSLFVVASAFLSISCISSRSFLIEYQYANLIISNVIDVIIIKFVNNMI